MVAAALSSELRREQTAIADSVTQEMLAVFGSLNFKAIDLSASGFVEASIAVAGRAHARANDLGSGMYLSMRHEAGVAGRFRVYQPLIDEVELRRALVVLGPIAAKNLMSSGVRIPEAAKRVFTLTTGRVSKTAIAGVRDTISGSTVQDSQAVCYARQVGSDPCDFCLRLAENTYKYAYSALYSAGNRKRNKNPQPMGSKFHDHCQCTVVPLFRGGPLTDILQDKQDREREFREAWADASNQGVGYNDFLESRGER